MKLSNKIFGAAAAIAIAAVMLTGCPDTVGETSNIGKDINITNDSSDSATYKRGYTTLATKHTSASALITLKDTASTRVDSANNLTGPGVIGFIYGIKDGNQTNKTTSETSKCFSIIGLRRNKNNKVEAYVSYFKNVSVSDTNINSEATLTDVYSTKLTSVKTKSAYEDDLTSGFKTITTGTSDDDIVIRVDVVAGGTDTDGDGTVEDGEGDGSYTVTISTTDTDGETAKDAILTKTIPASDTGDTTAKQYDLGLYTNVYDGETLQGKLTLVNIVNEAEVEE